MEGFRKRKVGGIAIKREALDAGSGWARWLPSLREEAERSAEARTALEKARGMMTRQRTAA